MRWPDGSSDPAEFLSREASKALFDLCVSLAKGGGEVQVALDSQWTGASQWMNNRGYISRDVRQTTLRLTRRLRGAGGVATTTQLDSAGLKAAMQSAERALQADVARTSHDTRTHRDPDPLPLLQPTLWSAATYGFDGEHRSALVRRMIAPAETAKMLATGELQIRARSQAVFNTTGVARYVPTTRVVCSTTVRDGNGTGSGWAGIDAVDITRVDLAGLGQRALEKGQRSINPVAIEPGRYVTILEPQAVADLWGQYMLFGEVTLDRELMAESPAQEIPFGRGNYRSRITERVLDPRLSLSADPIDTEGGFLPFRMEDGAPYRAVRWIDQGVLRELKYERSYAVSRLGLNHPLLHSGSWRLSGGTSSIEEMIATTKRGLLVTRFDGIRTIHRPSWTCSGYTRDGVWLIENGKISKPVKNLIFTESPMIALNQVEQLGVPVRVFSESGDGAGKDLAWIAPALKVRDFNFSRLADAV